MDLLTPGKSFETLKSDVVSAIQSHFPYEGRKQRVVLDDLRVDDKLDQDDIQSQAEVKEKEGTWGVPIRGTLRLIDKVTGKIVDEKKDAILARLPKLTNRHSFIVNGSEYQVDHLFRLKSGAYARVQKNGELETEFHLSNTKGALSGGQKFSVKLEPAKKRFTLKLGESHISLYPILKSMGVSDDQLEHEWGKAIFAANKPNDKKFLGDLHKFWKSTADDPSIDRPKDVGEYAKYVHDLFSQTTIRPDTTALTMGKPFTTVNGEALAIAAKKVLGISRGEQKPDDRDSLTFKEIVSVEDFIPQRIASSEKNIRHHIRKNVDHKLSVGDIIPPGLFNRPIHEFFTKGGSVAERSDQTNPIQMLSASRKTTLMSKDFGGIKGDHNLTTEMQVVNPSHFGFLDPMHTPECHDPETEVYTKTGWKKWPTVTKDDQLACQDDFGRMYFDSPIELYARPYKGLMYEMDNGKIAYLVTPNHRMWVRPYSSPGESKFRFETAEAVHGKSRLFSVAHKAYDPLPELSTQQGSYTFTLPVVEGDSKTMNVTKPLEMTLWAEFVGWFLSEGSATFIEEKGTYKVSISQSKEVNPEKYERIHALLKRLPFGEWGEDPGKGFYIGKKQVSSYLKQFGYCNEKYIPDYLFKTILSAREAFVEAMLLGDGRTVSNRKPGSKFKSYKQQVYCTTSPRLADDFEKLATDLGYSVSHKIYPDKREDRYFDNHEVRLLKHKERASYPNQDHYRVREFDGSVYCATVPGGLLFTRRPGRLGLWSGNSERTGITLHLSANARKNGRDLETPVYEIATGKTSHLPVIKFHQLMAVLPDQVKWVDGKPIPIAKMVKVKLPGGDIETRPFSEATHVMPSSKGLFDYASNLIPFLPTDQGNRVSMADKQLEQAISLKHREAPLVQSKTDSSDPAHTFEKIVGNFVTTNSPVAGKVTKITPGIIVIGSGKTARTVHLYDNFPLNDTKGMMHSEPVVHVGDEVTKGQLLADNNFTKDGALAIGANLRVGYIPYKGYNFEDGIVISESAAKKLTSEHLYKKDLELDPHNDKVSKEKLKAFGVVKSSTMTKEHWDALDEHGIIKPGTHVRSGQVLVAAVGKNMSLRQGGAMSAMGKRAWNPMKNKSLTWDEDHDGIVTKVVRSPSDKNIRVYVRTEEQMVIGDKLTGRHGNKGIVTRILPDHEMPHTVGKDGEKKHLEVLLNPSGVPTRINVGQMLETAAGKIAEKTGKTYIVDNFAGPDHDYRQQVLDDLRTHGLSDEEMVFDPSDIRRPLGSVLVGPQYLLKLKHQVEKKLTARGGGTTAEGKGLPYDVDKQPKKGAGIGRGGQGFGALDLYTLLGHNARHNIREMATYKSDMQDQTFWSMIQEGHEPPAPRIPFSYHKFTALLQGLGVNVSREGTGVRLLPMTNKEILQNAGNGKNEIKEGNKTIISKNLKPEVGGLFDPQATGGMDGDKWAFMRLHEPVPNPIFVGSNHNQGPVPVLLGLKIKEIDDIMAGRMELEGKVGGAGIEAALKKVDVNKEVELLKAELPHLGGATLDRANKKLRYLLALKNNNLKPEDAYILHNIPVLPPKFRPAIPTNKGDINYGPLNGLYKNIALLNGKMKDRIKELGEEHQNPVRSQLWDAVRALQSVGNYKPVYDVDSSGNRELKGILDTIGGGTGEQPKEGYFQKHLVKRRQDLSIRSTVIPEPAMGIDEVGLPRHAAMELYKPFVVAQLGRWGIDPLTAQEEIKKDSAIALKALVQATSERPILLKRDPVLHKFSIMAFKPKIVEGKAIQIHPLVTGGFNADFDGDTMAGTVPLSHEAVEEAKKMFPSNNLYSPTTGHVMYGPSQESLLGLHLLSKWGKDSGKTFENVETLSKAVDRGDLHTTDVVKVKGLFGGKPTTLGRILIESRLPRGFEHGPEILHSPEFEINSKVMSGKINPLIASKHESDFAKSINDLKDLGNEHSYKFGFSIGLKDLAPLKERKGILDAANLRADIAKKITNKDDRDKALVGIYTDATEQIDEATKKSLSKSDNRLAQMVFSGARGKPGQLRQMIAAPMLMQDSFNRTIPVPVTKSYSEGLDIGDYWLAQHGARKGTLQRAQGTRDPGAISKDILNSTMATLITSADCDTHQGLLMDINHKDLHDRFTATPYKLKDGTVLKTGTLITPAISSRLRNNKVDKVLVRSPLKCAHGDGICAKCFGLNENGKLHDIGTNIGVLAGQALGEPAVQMAMDAFHSGGTASSERGAKSVDRFTRLRNLLEMPDRLRDQATLAMASGRVTDVKKDEAGGLDIFIDGLRHYVPKNLISDKIKPGMELKKGDAISDGHINPHSLLSATKDIHAVQNHLVKEMQEGLYEKEGVRRRNVEVAVRAVTNLTKVRNPGSSDHLHGDVLPRTEVEEFNRNLPKGQAPIEHEPMLKGVREIPSLISKNWMARLNYQRLSATIQDAASGGWKSELHGSHPIPSIAMGSEFGRAPAGKPKHVY